VRPRRLTEIECRRKAGRIARPDAPEDGPIVPVLRRADASLGSSAGPAVNEHPYGTICEVAALAGVVLVLLMIHALAT
jgi:hypothetical protein